MRRRVRANAGLPEGKPVTRLPSLTLAIWLTAFTTLALLLSLSGCGGDSVTLQGVGATFPAPLYRSWFRDYNTQVDSSVRVNYQKSGSGAGVKSFVAEEVDFAASDAAMKPEEIARVGRGVKLLPMTAGSIVLGYNLPDLKAPLKLSREAYTKIFLREIERWNDPVIVACNPGTELPDLRIGVIGRADGSGTTYVFSQHLSAISSAWKSGPGTGKTIEWPDGYSRGRGNDGVTELIRQTEGGIGYIEFGFASENDIPMAWLENRSGKYVEPTLDAAMKALEAVELPEDMIAWIPDPAGPESYPIVTYTWLLIYGSYDDPKISETLRKVLKYCATEGQKKCRQAGYVPLPKTVQKRVLAAVETIH